ncbi:MAG: MFS transporter, partial [Prosthecobacter sp.]|nr:MFS transporter [Prosthecobacter sp.]
MALATDTASDPAVLDDLAALPPRSRWSLASVLLVQSLNAFNDNFVKMLIIAFAGAVAHGQDIGDSMQVYLGAIFSLPYVLFAPIAGWLSDRWSKQRVIFWMQVLQVFVFLTFIGALWLHQTQLTLYLSLVAFFLLATQAAFFSPAKMGIIKELVGTRRLGGANGMLQMTMFIGILSGMWAGGTWFGARLAATNDPWSAVWVPMLAVTILALLQIAGALTVARTPTHPEVKFERRVFWEHFTHLR